MKNPHWNWDFEELFKAGYNGAAKHLSRWTEHELCEDCAQEAIAKMLKRDPSSVTNPNGLVTTIASRIAISLQRDDTPFQNYLLRGVIPIESNGVDTPEDRTVTGHLRKELASRLLSMEHLDVLHLVAVMVGVSADEFRSGIYGTFAPHGSLATVYTHRRNAVEKAREVFSN